MCRMFGVSQSGYYDWTQRGLRPHPSSNVDLDRRIRVIFTEHRQRYGAPLYLAVVLDLYSRAIVGWAMSARMTQQLVCDALTMALFRRHFPRGAIIHSDRGSQYCSQRYQHLIKSNDLCCSMGHKANCYDNAVTESFFHTLKIELVHRERYGTRRRAQSRIFEYIETYYNRRRRHSAIGHQVPMIFEQVA